MMLAASNELECSTSPDASCCDGLLALELEPELWSSWSPTSEPRYQQLSE